MTDIETRLQRLEDLEQLRDLKHRYAAFCDAEYDADGLADLFTEDAVWDGGVLGRYEGRDAIRAFFAGASAQMPFAIHQVSNAVLDIDGERATGRWYLWQPCINDDQALWLAGTYADRYRRDAGAWRFEHVDLQLRMLSPYELGWGKARFGDGAGVMSDARTSELVTLFLQRALAGHIEEAVEALLAPDIVWDNPLPDPIPFGGRWEGHAGVTEYVRRLIDNIEIEAFDIADIIEHGEYVTLTGTETSLVKQTGRRYTVRWAHVVRARGGRVVEWREYNDSAAMLSAFA
jgi:ketosteroid isomerase-like protein